jgi:hypothetical protein
MVVARWQSTQSGRSGPARNCRDKNESRVRLQRCRRPFKNGQVGSLRVYESLHGAAALVFADFTRERDIHAGLSATAIAIKLRRNAKSAHRALVLVKGPVVLAGHSWGGR